MRGCSVPTRINVPAAEPDLICQYRSTDTYSDAGITPSVDGGLIQQINDLSGNGHHLIQTAFDSNKPILSVGEGIQDKPTITHNGANHYIWTNFGEAYTGEFDAFIVVQINSHFVNDWIFDGFTSQTFALVQSVGAGELIFSQNAFDSNLTTAMTGFTIGSGFHLLRLKLNLASSFLSEDKESTETTLPWTPSTPIAHQMDGFSVAGKSDGSGLCDMNWMEAFVFNSIKTGEAETNIYNYLIDCYGLGIL